MFEAEEVLQKFWGYKTFRKPQKEIIESVLSGNDTLALLPTGGGKSICFQVPALLMEGICLVISPLIALMKDQVEQLEKRGIKAISITSGLSKKQVDIALDNCIYGNYKFLYVSPERLKTDLFVERSKKMDIALIAIDEAHCISQWGYDFRPSYLDISAFSNQYQVPKIALTASATPTVQKDIIEKLPLYTPSTFQKSFIRKNLTYSVFELENKEGKLLEILSKVPGSAIVYVRTRKRTEEISSMLKKNKISSDFYHGGIRNEIRAKKQESWLNSNIRVMVCTNAFGMGIDKPDVRLVIHLDIPPDVESYYQEAGRAGRDGNRSFAVLLYQENDLAQLKEQVIASNPSVEELKKVYQSIANYLKIAVGSAYMQNYNFTIEEFCKTFQLKVSTTFYAVKALESIGLISLNESFYSKSQLIFLLKSEELYRFEIEHKELERIIKAVLRLYGGEAYSSYVYIKEVDLVKLLKIPEREIIKLLIKLDKHSVIDYQKIPDRPQITFLTPRMNINEIDSRVKILKERTKVKLQKVHDIIDYIKLKNACRSNYIANYFGEQTSEDCGYCDYCLKKNKVEDTSKILQLKTEILKSIGKGKTDLNTLYGSFPSFKKDEINQVVRILADENYIQFLKGEMVTLKRN